MTYHSLLLSSAESGAIAAHCSTVAADEFLDILFQHASAKNSLIPLSVKCALSNNDFPDRPTWQPSFLVTKADSDIFNVEGTIF